MNLLSWLMWQNTSRAFWEYLWYICCIIQQWATSSTCDFVLASRVRYIGPNLVHGPEFDTYGLRSVEKTASSWRWRRDGATQPLSIFCCLLVEVHCFQRIWRQRLPPTVGFQTLAVGDATMAVTLPHCAVVLSHGASRENEAISSSCLAACVYPISSSPVWPTKQHTAISKQW